MKKTYAYFALLLLAFAQISCQDKKQTTESDATITTDSTSQVNNTLENYTLNFKAILKTDAGMVRGLSIGDEMNVIVIRSVV